jgi:O-antigen/teichoic acid export membrane protein
MLQLLYKKISGSVFRNSAWGIFSNLFQNVLFSVFFIVIARKYSTDDFANYILANTLYAFVVAFSSLGLGQWFIRELLTTKDKQLLINQFFKIQFYIGLVFYIINLIIAILLYNNTTIRALSVFIGINVIFDNIIYVIKYINIAEEEQKKSFIILTIEAILKFGAGCLLFIYPIPIVYLSVILIGLRFITLNLFIKIGCSNLVNIKKIIQAKVQWQEVKQLLKNNWSFVIIGSISIIYWRMGNILVSKILMAQDVANYEISFKLFSMAEILPVIVSTSIFPLLVKTYQKSKEETVQLFKKAFIAYALYGILAFSFIYSFSDAVIPFLFGAKYVQTPVYCKEMFLTILVFPTALLQANLLVAMKLEKKDMWLNIISLLINIGLSVTGFYFYKTLSVINYSIFISFLAFHLLQDFVLIKRKLISITHTLLFYTCTALIVGIFYWGGKYFNQYILFIVFWFVVCMLTASILFSIYKNTLAKKLKMQVFKR